MLIGIFRSIPTDQCNIFYDINKLSHALYTIQLETFNCIL